MFPRFTALALVFASATVFVGCAVEEVDDAAQADTAEAVGTAEEALTLRCRVCNSGCYYDYCDTSIEYCDPTVGCVPY